MSEPTIPMKSLGEDIRADMPVRLVLVDDAAELRSMLRVLFERTGRVKVVAEYGDCSQVMDTVKDERVDVVVVDLAMPGGGALELIAEIRAARPDVAIIVLSGYPASTTAQRCLDNGADRYFEKGRPFRELLAAVLEMVGEWR